MAEVHAAEQLDSVWEYPLFEAIYGRRSRRFGMGFEIIEGPFPYKSAQAPVALSELEEALLVAAGVGVTGAPLWDSARHPSRRQQMAEPMAAHRVAADRRCSSPMIAERSSSTRT